MKKNKSIPADNVDIDTSIWEEQRRPCILQQLLSHNMSTCHHWNTQICIQLQSTEHENHKKDYSQLWLSVFTVLHGMQTRFSDENSVCLSVKRVNCDKTEE